MKNLHQKISKLSFKNFKKKGIISLVFLISLSCVETKKKMPFLWENATVYFMLTDRFANGDKTNDVNFDRTEKAAKLRGFEGGDIKGITKKIKEGYFNNLGVNAIWLSPILEQIHGNVDEGTGVSYGFHGYWTKDWTALDPNFGAKKDLKDMVNTAHANGIRVLLDAVINHTGPVTGKDTVYPENWVRTGPQCTYQDYESTVSCTLVENLPDIKTESSENVELPNQLKEKWIKENRYEAEVEELDAFFATTGYPRAPKYYVMKWLSDYVKDYGIDGYRIDTVKHTEENVWQDFRVVCDSAFAEYKKNNPNKILDNAEFYLVGEVYNYGISGKQNFDFGDRKVNYYDGAFNSLINFEFKWDAAQLSYEDLFSKYTTILQSDLKGYSVLNYVSSHDDGQPFDKERKKPYESATKLLLTPGVAQVYYGDETARSLIIEGTVGDATLRSFMNWEDVENNKETQNILTHWQKLGRFRNNHPSVGAGKHQMISDNPYVFSRVFSNESYGDNVVIGLDLEKGEKELIVSSVFNNGDRLMDVYSNQEVEVKDGRIIINSVFDIVLLEKK